MANLRVVDGASATKYLKTSGAGSDGDPHIPEHLETNSADILTAVEAIQAAAEAIQTAVELLDNIVGGSEAQVDVVTSALPSGAATAANQSTLIGHVDGVEALLTTIDADTSALAATVAGSEQQVDIVASLPAGTNAIGKLAANSGVDIGDVDVTSIAAGENLIGLVGASDMLVEITPTLDTGGAYTSGDVLFTATEIANVSRVAGKHAILESIMVVDKDDQKQAFNIHLFDRNVTSGAANGAPSISDDDGAYYMGTVKVVADDYFDLGGVSVANPSITPKVVKPGNSGTSLYAFAVSQGTPTHTASGLVIKFGFLRA